MPSASLDFTDRSRFNRFTITAPGVSPQSKIQTSIQQTNVTAAQDYAVAYVPNVVSVGQDTFDVDVFAFEIDGAPVDGVLSGPAQIVLLNYSVLN